MIRRIKKVISKVMDDPQLENSLSDEADMIYDVGLDSLQMIDFMLRIEDEFETELNFDTLDFTHMRSIQKFADYLQLQIPRINPGG